MRATLVSLLLIAALMHASWNGLLKSGSDKLASVTLMSLPSAAAAALLSLLLPPLSPVAWPYAAGSAAVQIVYCLALARAYDHGELSQIYPLARGSAPMLVAIGAALSAGEWPSAVDLMGLALVSAGILALSLGRERLSPAGMVSALFVGSCIAGYMILDGLGVRFSRNPASYIAWMTLAQTLPMPLVYRALRRTWPILRRDRETLKGFAAGLLGLGGYAIVVWAMSMTQMARVSGLRETSILFATLIGVIFLNEPFTVRRSISSLAITAGVICLAAY